MSRHAECHHRALGESARIAGQATQAGPYVTSLNVAFRYILDRTRAVDDIQSIFSERGLVVHVR
jgi:hypothetical protein